MNQYDRLKENRRQYSRQFLLGFFGGGGLVSALILALHNYFNRNRSTSKYKTEDDKGPEQFEIISGSSEKDK